MRSRLALGTTVAVTAALLAGCNVPGTVAVVDGERITTREYAQAHDLTVDITRGDANITPTVVGALTTSYLVMAPAIEAAGKEYGITASDQQVVDGVNYLTGGQYSWEIDDFTESQMELARAIVVSTELQTLPEGNQIVSDIRTSTAASTELNPRYGEFNSEGYVVPVQSPWIEQPVPEVTG